MGTFGVSGMLITEKNGPRIRFVSVITTAEFPYGMPSEEHHCRWCMKCKDECPAEAVASDMYPDEITEKQKCLEHSVPLREKGTSPCGRCIFVCPVGDDMKDPLPADDAIKNIQRYMK